MSTTIDGSQHSVRTSLPIASAPTQRARGFRSSLGSLMAQLGAPTLFVLVDVAVIFAIALGMRTPDILPVALLIVVCFYFVGLYQPKLSLSVLDDMPAILTSSLGVVGVFAISLALLGNDIERSEVVQGLTLVSALVLGRVVAYALVRTLRARRVVQHRTLVLGAGRIGNQIAQSLLDHPLHGLTPVGFLDSDPMLSKEERAVPLLGDDEQLADAILRNDISTVIVAFGGRRANDTVDVIRTCDRLECDMLVVPRMFELHQSGSTRGNHVRGLPLLRLQRPAFRSPSRHLKRMLDFLAAGFALLLLSPLMALIALLVRLEGPNVIFRQERVGLDGRSFMVLKFRSMRATREESASQWSIANDSRVSRLGRILRVTSMDELPQLWNVVRGDMSMVGPRPERPVFVRQFSDTYRGYHHRHRVKAGITGWAQINGLRGDTSIEERAAFDNYYIENWSLWLDAKILLRTVTSLVSAPGR